MYKVGNFSDFTKIEEKDAMKDSYSVTSVST